MERAIEPEEERPGALQDEEDYLALFISRSLEGDSSFGEMVPAGPEHSGPEIKYSKFLTSYARLDPDSGTGLVRLSSAEVPPDGFTVHGEETTLLCYSLSGEGDVITGGRALRCALARFCPKWANRIAVWAEWGTIGILGALALAATFYWKLGMLPLTAVTLLAIKAFLRKRPCKLTRFGVQ